MMETAGLGLKETGGDDGRRDNHRSGRRSWVRGFYRGGRRTNMVSHDEGPG